MKNLILIPFMILLLMIAGCDNSKPEDSRLPVAKSADIQQVKETAKKTIDNAVSKVHTVTIKAMQFHPAQLTINEGDEVVWINEGVVVHDVSEYPNKTWTSGNIEVGKSWKTTPKESFEYFCSIHPTMRASIQINKK